MTNNVVYCAGTEVEVFYRLERDGEGYFPVPNYAARCIKPRFGITDGWMKARVLEDWPPPPTAGKDWPPLPSAAGGKGDRKEPTQNGNGSALAAWAGTTPGPSIRVIHTHQLWADRYGQALDPERERDMVMNYPACDVRPLAAPGTAYPEPTLSLLVVRWGGEETHFNVEQWGSASASTSSAYVSAFVDSAIYPILGPDYEVHAVFISSGLELAKLGPAAACQVMRGRHKAACYFLWPVMHQDGEVHESGMVDQSHFFEAVRLFETAGVCTRFPHPSQLYRTLLAKDWQPTLCLVPKFMIPPTVTVNRATIAASPARAATLTVDALAAVRACRYKKKGEEPIALRVGDNEARRGVAKLGFAWEAAHVRTFRGEAQLATALIELSTSPSVTNASVVVQDFAKNDFELRQFVVDGEVVHKVYSNFAWTDSDGYFREFVMKDRAAAVASWMSGDEPAMAQAERKAAKLARAWLTWMKTQSVEALPGVRMDILIKRTGPGEAEVFTLELTELGFSMLGVEALPPLVFGALLRSCFEDTGPSEDEGRRLTEGIAKLNAKAKAVHGGKKAADASQDGNAHKRGKHGGNHENGGGAIGGGSAVGSSAGGGATGGGISAGGEWPMTD